MEKVVAPCMGSKADVMSGRGYLFLTVIGFNPNRYMVAGSYLSSEQRRIWLKLGKKMT